MSDAREPAIRIEEVTPDALATWSNVSIAHVVTSVLGVSNCDVGINGIALTETEVSHPYTKDYDQFEGGPSAWGDAHDLASWRLFQASDGEEVVGGAITIAGPYAAIPVLDDHDDCSMLWDLRVAPPHRGKGIGRALLQTAAVAARKHDHKRLLIETQNTNVPACKFYAKQGCRLLEIRQGAYAGTALAHEILLMWQLDL